MYVYISSVYIRIPYLTMSKILEEYSGLEPPPCLLALFAPESVTVERRGRILSNAIALVSLQQKLETLHEFIKYSSKNNPLFWILWLQENSRTPHPSVALVSCFLVVKRPQSELPTCAAMSILNYRGHGLVQYGLVKPHGTSAIRPLTCSIFYSACLAPWPLTAVETTWDKKRSSKTALRKLYTTHLASKCHRHTDGEIQKSMFKLTWLYHLYIIFIYFYICLLYYLHFLVSTVSWTFSNQGSAPGRRVAIIRWSAPWAKQKWSQSHENIYDQINSIYIILYYINNKVILL